MKELFEVEEVTPLIDINIYYFSDMTCGFSVKFGGEEIIHGNAKDLKTAFTQTQEEVNRYLKTVLGSSRVRKTEKTFPPLPVMEDIIGMQTSLTKPNKGSSDAE